MEERAPQPNPSNSNRDLIQKFREEYGAALSDARQSAEHTATPGWQALYAQHKQACRDARRGMGKSLATYAKLVEDFGLSEDDEKAIKEITKTSAELREMVEVFQGEVIDRVCAPVVSCENLILHYRAEAARVESQSPMYHVGLEELMRMECSKQPKPVFDVESGMVEIREPQD
jgi:hypothetical protein